jgi:hypothetical protein
MDCWWCDADLLAALLVALLAGLWTAGGVMLDDLLAALLVALLAVLIALLGPLLCCGWTLLLIV